MQLNVFVWVEKRMLGASLEILLKSIGMKVYFVTSSKELMAQLDNCDPELVIFDESNSSVEEFLKKSREVTKRIHLLLSAKEGEIDGLFYIKKPINPVAFTDYLSEIAKRFFP